MKQILIISGHPDLAHSLANKTILEELQKLLPVAEYAYLDRLYPDFRIDAETEQKRLQGADVIVLQVPLVWYGMPALMHKWMEDTFTHGFSHGSEGDKLKGKQLVVSFTSGASEDMYSRGGLQNYPIEDFLPPLRQMANLCRMKWGGYVYSGGLSYAGRADRELARAMREKAVRHARRLVEVLDEL